VRVPEPSAPGAPYTLLLVDDDVVFRGRLARAFRQRGFQVSEAGDRDGAMVAAAEETPELAVVDLRLPGDSGLEVVRDLKRLDPATNVVVLTGFGSIATALESLRLGATHYLTKPVDAGQILAAFQRADGAAAPLPADPFATPSLARVEWEHIQRVLTECGGNVSQAARILGLHRRSLQRKLAKRPVAR
jgi:two-component system response regulator RegA